MNWNKWVRQTHRWLSIVFTVLVVVNATPTPEYNYRLGVPAAGRWDELLNSDASHYGGSGLGNYGGVLTAPLDSHDHHQSVVLTLPPLAAIALAPSG